ncbi:hypothetical protein ABEV34_06900 [Methylorubrum rhodesianum]|uniref:hypothetical protein n=1 Tax=Methylorubrum TaxID=2282523 RepID=UPI00161BAB56|nr:MULTISPECIES: hypothetical protein [Methylorubrum]MBB5765677.1 hypothetical protein [Methylorubrum rhodesianum]
MSSDLVPSDSASPKPMRSGPMLMQKVGVLTAKAALSSIPFAALAFDIGQAGVEFANGRLVDRFLDQLGDRIDQLEAGARERLQADDVHQTTADTAIRRLLTETNPRMADALSRAVAEIGKAHRPPTERMEIARALSVLTEPNLHFLQSFYRMKYQQTKLTPAEEKFLGPGIPGPGSIARIVAESMPLTTWLPSALSLQAAALVTLAGENNAPIDMTSGAFPVVKKVLPLGQLVLHLCFEDPEVPAFGKFAVPAPER